MSTKDTVGKASHIRHSDEYKQESLKLAAQIGVAKAAKQLGLHASQLYTWRKQAEHTKTVSEREASLAAENARLKRQLAQQAEELSLLKNGGDVLRSTVQARYGYMKNHRAEYSMTVMCQCFQVSRSGYYAWLNRKPSARHQKRQAFDQQVKALFLKHKQRYGAERLQRKMPKASGQFYDLKTIAASLKRQGLVAKAARKFKATTNSKHNLPVFDNLLQQDFSATAPNQKWAGDITYLWTDEGWLYLAVMIDLFSRQVVGWAMSERMTTDLVCDALKMAIFRRKRPKGVRVHSDRGSQYCSHAYRQLLEQYQLLGSMSAKGSCYDNACSESFFHSLKVEAIHGERFENRETMRQTVFEYIETDYNPVRLHSTNGFLSPMEFETQFYQSLAS
ncbi:IS3 family transposase [Methylomonas sp. MV1]|nr:IS3 family transposase [Methylomonas sp. MV1]MDT4330763.1 IS3 family transposase [Methylomonas sp. MV1]